MFRFALFWLSMVSAVWAQAQRVLIQTGDRLTLLRNGEYSVFYVQSVVQGRAQFIVYSMESHGQYYMDAEFLRKFLVKVERKSRVIYLIEN